MELCRERRGTIKGMDYLSEERAELHCSIPMTEIVFDLLDQLKPRTRGYISLNCQESEEQIAGLVKINILSNDERADTFSVIVHKDVVYSCGQKMTGHPKEPIPRQ